MQLYIIRVTANFNPLLNTSNSESLSKGLTTEQSKLNCWSRCMTILPFLFILLRRTRSICQTFWMTYIFWHRSMAQHKATVYSKYFYLQLLKSFDKPLICLPIQYWECFTGALSLIPSFTLGYLYKTPVSCPIYLLTGFIKLSSMKWSNTGNV